MNTTACACGCGKPTNVVDSRGRPRGFCKGHHSPANVSVRFWSKVDKNGPIPIANPELGPCWIWTASTVHGYGQFRMPRQTGGMIKAHVMAWFLTYGSIPIGQSCCHKCDNPPCVRPDHHFLGTMADNSADMVAKGRSLRGARNPKAKLSAQDIVVIRNRHSHAYGVRKRLAAEYRVSISTISAIVSRNTWSHITNSMDAVQTPE